MLLKKEILKIIYPEADIHVNLMPEILLDCMYSGLSRNYKLKIDWLYHTKDGRSYKFNFKYLHEHEYKFGDYLLAEVPHIDVDCRYRIDIISDEEGNILYADNSSEELTGHLEGYYEAIDDALLNIECAHLSILEEIRNNSD